MCIQSHATVVFVLAVSSVFPPCALFSWYSGWVIPKWTCWLTASDKLSAQLISITTTSLASPACMIDSTLFPLSYCESYIYSVWRWSWQIFFCCGPVLLNYSVIPLLLLLIWSFNYKSFQSFSTAPEWTRVFKEPPIYLCELRCCHPSQWPSCDLLQAPLSDLLRFTRMDNN